MSKTIYKKKIKNGKEYYFYRLRHNNLIKPKDVYAPTVKELETKIKELTTELDNNISDNKQLFGTFVCNWLFDVHCINIKPSSKERYEGIYRNYIKSSPVSDIKLRNLSTKHIQDYYNSLIKKGKSVNVIKNINKVIAPSIRYAFDTNKIIKDFSKSVVLPKENETTKLNKVSDVQPFSLKEQQNFIAAIADHELEVLFLTALNTGMRQGELLALTWSDVNFKDNTITVTKSIKLVSDVTKEGRKSSKFIVQTPKSVAGNRTITIPEFLTKRLEKYQLQQKELRLKLSNLYDDHTLVFCNMFGRYLDSSNVRKKFKKVLSDNGIRERKFHDLRHTYATRLFELGEDPKTVQTLLGHSSLSMTLDTYTHVLEGLKKKAASKLNDLYDSMWVK